MRRVVSLALGTLLIFACELSTAEAQSPGTQSAAAVWVAHQGVASLRVGRGVVQSQVEQAAALLLPFERDPRFTLKGTSIRHLPHKNLIEIKSEAEVSVAFVSDKTVSVTIQLRPEIYEESLRLVMVRKRLKISGCVMEGPICFMVKRAVDRHLGDGQKLQAFLDDGLNTALRPVFRSAADAACGDRHAIPRRVTTAPEFLDVLMAASASELSCLRSYSQAQAAGDRSAAFKREEKAQKARAHRSLL